MNNLKDFVKNYAPAWALNPLIRGRKKWIALTVGRYDQARFNDSRLHQIRGANLEQLEGKLIFHSHALEKGLSHTNIRFRFGATALQSLAETMQEYKRQDFRCERLPYLNALSTLKAYIDRHMIAGVEPNHLMELLGAEILDEVANCGSTIGGVTSVNIDSKRNKRQENFKELFQNRYSVREFADAPVAAGRILPAIELAMKSPSVCNRQSARVKIVTDSSLVDKILNIQGGMKGYASPPALLVVTADLSTFLGPTERNQPFIDGGLFSMSLLLALEYEQLAACPLNAMMSVKEEEAIRQLLNLSQSERLIVFVAVGEFPGETQVPKSFRFTADDIATTYM